MKTLQERFEEKFAKSDNGCWMWTASKNQDGYGKFVFSGRLQKAHRVAWTLYVGEIPDGMCILHRCDNRYCVNPTHLFMGTKADNARDRDSKGRGACLSGEKHWRSKLTDEQVKTIRERRNSGALTTDLAKDFGMSQQAISDIVLYRNWRQ